MTQPDAPTLPFPLRIQTHQMFNGLAAGNIGDELMMLGFFNLMQPVQGSSIEVWNDNSPAIHWFPDRYRYIPWLDDGKCERCASAAQAVLLVGDTPVSELVGLDWPLRALTKRLKYCHARAIPVHAVGVGVDHLNDPEASGLFREAFLPIASWTVRSAGCRCALTALGVPDDRIVVASDLAWLYEPVTDLSEWALSQWRLLGIDGARPLIGVNPVREVWGNNAPLYRSIAAALDRIAMEHDAQIVFMCNEVRDGAYFDRAAAESVMGMMATTPFFLPNRYYHPDAMIALLSHVDVTLSQRYHFTVESVMAGSVPVSFARGQKLAGLLDELGMDPVGDMENADPDDIYRAVTDALERRDDWRDHLMQVRESLRVRAMRNGHFIQPLGAGNTKRGAETITEDYARKAVTAESMTSRVRLASVAELDSAAFRGFMALVNGLALQWGFRVFTNWSKIWEYPWIWFNALYKVQWPQKHLVDIGSEISPMPWLIAMLGARVTLIETDGQWIPLWEKLKERLRVDVHWHIVTDETLPFPDMSADVVTSFSVIEHQPDKTRGINEINRILKPGGILAVSFDICEPEMGMSFPEWNGTALTMPEFESVIWRHPAFGNSASPEWNREDIASFLSWHKASAPHHQYVVGAAVLRKQSAPLFCSARFFSGWFDEEADASGSWRWSGSRGAIELHCADDRDVRITFELASVPDDNRIRIFMDGREMETIEIVWPGFSSVTPLTVPLKKGIHMLEFQSRKAPAVLPSDSRPLAFSIKNFILSS